MSKLVCTVYFDMAWICRCPDGYLIQLEAKSANQAKLEAQRLVGRAYRIEVEKQEANHE